MTATTALTVAGEFHANIPSREWRAKIYVTKGAPLGYVFLCRRLAYFDVSVLWAKN